MECRECRQNMTSYMAGILEKDTKKDIELHLSYCPSCQAEFQEFKEIDSLIKDADIFIPDIDLTNSIMAGIKNEPVAGRHRQKKMFPLLQDLVAAAAAAIIIFWISGSLSGLNNVPNYTLGVVKVSDSVGGAFQTYINLPITAIDKVSDSFMRFSPENNEGR